MTTTMPNPARKEVIALPPYGAGQTIEQATARNLHSNMINLSVNENPLGPSPAALNAFKAQLHTASCYPDSQCTELSEQLATKLNVAREQVVLGNGSEDVLSMLCKAFLSRGDKVLVAKPTFALHGIYANMMGAKVLEVPMQSDLSYRIDDWLDAIAHHPDLKMLMLANPSNPIGCTFDANNLQRLIDACPLDTVIVIDEAYCEYAQGHKQFVDSLTLLQTQPRPYAVLRTFSKAYGLAGLRVGYGVMSNAQLADYLHRVRTPYNVNRLAQLAAIAVLQDPSYLADTVTQTNSEREKLSAALTELGYFVAPSLANFLFIDVKQPSEHVASLLLQQGIMIKPWLESGFDHFVRVSIGLPEQNLRVLEAFKQL
ncbi:histidinol-phosphate transaminase [Pseudoalteromonas maricaloris]|uniref:histidinol-phosphate transaminase n=1 Tax=Pseudoalteromonas maricaloris TaxID=184924 RepID=UPI003C1D36F2